MKAATLFSGIGSPEMAKPEWDWIWCAEIEPFPSAVLKHRHPHSVNLGDVNAPDFIERAEAIGRPDVLVFGSPCQSFSVAGRRLGLDDPRGNLALVALGIVNRLKPSWFIFENVPGLMSSADGSDFGIFLRAVDELGYCGAWSVLDAQYFGLAQRRARLFFVGHLGDWRGPAAVLLEPESLCGNHPPRRAPRERVTGTVEARTSAGGAGWGTDFMAGGGLAADEPAKSVPARPWPALREDADTLIVGAVSSKWSKGTGGPSGDECYNLVAQQFSDVADPITANEGKTWTHEGNTFRMHNVVTAFTAKDSGGDARDDLSPTLRAGTHDKTWANGGVMPAIAFDTTQITHPENRCNPQPDDACHPLAADAHPQAVAFQTRIARNGRGQPEEICPTLNGSDAGDTSDMRPVVALPTSAVRRLTPTECARLQGFPDTYLNITFRGKPAADGNKYKALGNSMAVPVLRWILERIEAVDG